MPNTYLPESLLDEAEGMRVRSYGQKLYDDMVQRWTPAQPEPAPEPAPEPQLGFGDELKKRLLEPFNGLVQQRQQADQQAAGGFTPEQKASMLAPFGMGAQPITGNESVPSGGVQPVMRGSVGGGVSGDTPDAVRAYVRQAAIARGIDPAVAERVMDSEGGPNPGRQSDFVSNGKRETSFGPFQLFTGGGLGNTFQQRTGLDPADPAAWRQTVDFALDEAARGGWGPWHGAARVGVGDRQGVEGARPIGISPVEPKGAGDGQAGTPLPSSGQSTSGAFSDLTPDQFNSGLSTADAYAACGVVAAVAFARKNGRNPTVQEATNLAKQYGWSPEVGMGRGTAGTVDTANALGAAVKAGPVDSNRMAEDVQRGNPVGINLGGGAGNNGHFMVAERYDPNTGKFDFGNSAKALKASGGNTWFSLAELPKLGFGSPRDAIYADAPDSPSPSVVAGASPKFSTKADAGPAGGGMAQLEMGTSGAQVLPQESDQSTGGRPAGRDIQSDYGPVPGTEPGDFQLETPDQRVHQLTEDISRANDQIYQIETPGNGPTRYGDYQNQLADRASPSQPGGAVEPASTDVSPSAVAPASSGNPIVDLFSDFGRKLSDFIGPKPDLAQGAADIQQRSQTFENPPGPMPPERFAQDIGAAADAVGTAGNALSSGVAGMAEASQRDYETYTRLNGRMLQGEHLTPEEEQEMASAAVRIIGNVDGTGAMGLRGGAPREAIEKAVELGAPNAQRALDALDTVTGGARGVGPSAGIVPRAAGQADEAAQAAATDRYYHGTGSDFASLDPKRGAAWMTKDPEYASEYATGATIRELELGRRSQQGANVRAIDVPNDLKILNADNAADAAIMEDAVSTAQQRFPNPNDWVKAESLRNKILADSGYDGIGLRNPGSQEGANDTLTIFPESLDKIRNATAGTPGGFLPGEMDKTTLRNANPIGRAVGSGVGAGYQESQREGSTPESIATAAVGGAITSGVNTAIGRNLRPGPSAGIVARVAQQTRQDRAAELSRPITLTTEEEIARIKPEKFPAEIRDDLIAAAKSVNFGQRLRRGVLGDKEVQQLAQEYAPSVESAIAASHRGKAYNAEEIVGLRNLVVGQHARVKELSEELADKGFNVGTAAQLAAEQAKFRAVAEIAFGGAPAEAGRALRQFRQLAQNIEVDPAGAGLRYLKSQFGSLDRAEESMSKYLSMVQDGADPVALASFLRGARGSWLNRLGIVRYASMLSSTATHALNATANGIMSGVDVATTPLQVGIDMARSQVSGKPREVFIQEMPAQLHGMAGGVVQGLRDAAFTMKNGFGPDDITQLDHLREGFGTNIPKIAPAGSKAAGVIDFIAEGPLRTLGAADKIFRGMAEGGHLAREATAKALMDGRGVGGKVSADVLREYMDNPNIADRAFDLAKRSVLQEDTFARKLSGFLRTQPEGIQQAVGSVMPFMATPYSVVAQGVGMTPAGVVKAIADAKAGKGARNVEETLARSMIGTAVMGWAGWQYAQGNITGPRPESEAERSTLPPGWREWSFRVATPDGAVRYVPMAPLGPLAIPAAVGALIAESGKQGTLWKPETLGQVALGVGKYASDQTFLRGMSDLAGALNEGGSKIDRLVEGMASSYSPHFLGGGALGNEIQTIMQMPQRDPQNAVQAFLARMPYGDQISPKVGAGEIPIRRDVIGRPQMTSPGIETAVVRTSLENDAPVIAAYRNAGEGLPMSAPKQVRDPLNASRRIDLTPEQQNDWKSYFGTMLERGWINNGRPRDTRQLRQIEQQARDDATERVVRR